MDSGYQGLARDFPAQVSAPPKKPGAGLKGVFQSIGMTGRHDNQQVP
jgi:hypothetical protein